MPKTMLVVSMAVLAGCAPAREDRPVGMANPASVYCEDQGGRLRIEQRPGGQVGICVLASGEEIEEWALYRRDHPAPKQ
ncbi:MULTISPECIES: DUF333 domain-containing protein [unclassified Pigmentiphaga]|jgi:uncharacterized protein|uniref:putative hemolysin n=1 Tax=unclassified Pigmentiphaga TaxID=2626614 RepID=UPI000B420A8F|nr:MULTISPECIES: DUF333 domain-containing protein [unclassified Pigmentiphaga]OVZ63465.1 hemolysin [Pigmentiphaga sp. NML030171]